MKNRVFALVLFIAVFSISCEKVENISLKDQTADQVFEKPAHFFIYTDITNTLTYIKSWSDKPIELDVNVYENPVGLCVSQDKKRLAFSIYGYIYIYDLINNRLIRQFSSSITGKMSWSTDNAYLYVLDNSYNDYIFEIDVSTGRSNILWSLSNTDRIVSFAVDKDNSIVFTQNENVVVGGTSTFRSSLYVYTKGATKKIKSVDFSSSSRRGDGLTLGISDSYDIIRVYTPDGTGYSYYSSPYTMIETNPSYFKKINSTLTYIYSQYTVYFTYKDVLGSENKETYPHFEGVVNGIYY